MLHVLIYYLVDLAGSLYNPPEKLCKDQLLRQFSSGLADRGAFHRAMLLENRRSEPIPNNSAQAEEEDKQPISNPILNSSEQTVQADNARPPSLLLPMEAASISTDRSPWNSTTEAIQTMQLRQRDLSQQPSETDCISCNTVIDPNGLCLSCLDRFVNLDAFADHGTESQSSSERAAYKPPDDAVSAEFGEMLHPARLASVGEAKEYVDEGFPLSDNDITI